jgi:hypothetical protein
VWPTEIHAQGRRVEKAIRDLERSGGGTTFGGVALGQKLSFDREKYRVKLQIPRGDEAVDGPVAIGRNLKSSAPETFRGVVDNVIFQGNYAPQPGDVYTGNVGAPVARFDVWRPQAHDKLTRDGDAHLTYQKRSAPLEWDRPIRIIGYEWTAWKNNEDGEGYLDLGLV